VRRLLGPVAALLLALVAATAAGAQPAEVGLAARQEGENRAGLVIQNGDGAVQTACVRFDEPEISGLELLERSGIPIVAQVGAVGAAVCKIGPEGCDYPAERCFCERDGPRSIYWAFYLRDGEEWRYSAQSAGSVPVRDGDVQGWAWGLGESGVGAVPPLIDLDTICPAPAAPSPAEAEPGAATPAPTAATPPLSTAAALSPAAPTPASGASRQEGLPGYVGFIALAGLLVAGGVAAARRRR